MLKSRSLLGQVLKNQRNFSTKRTWEEVRIPGPWGELAGKWWGPRDKRPILGLHGWQDNCGTFDTLAPLLPSHVGLLAVDMPGHGLSAQLPPGTFYHGIDIVVFIRRIAEHFNWPKVSLLAHSLGAMNSFIYTMLFPESVDFLICIDGLYPIHVKKNRHPKYMAKTVDKFLKYDTLNNSGKEPPSYTYADLEQLWHKGSKNSIDVAACKYILQRNIAPVKNNPNRFSLTRDLRLKVASLLYWTEEDVLEGSKRITCPLFLSMGKSSPFMQVEHVTLTILEMIKENNKNVEYHVLDGTHHLHLNHPESVADLINNFIKKYDVDDRLITDLKNKIRIVL